MPNIFDDLIPSAPEKSMSASNVGKNIFDDILPAKQPIPVIEPKTGYDQFFAKNLRNEILKNKAAGVTFDNTIPQPKERPIQDRILALTKSGTEATIPGMIAKAIGKPMINDEESKRAQAKYPGASLAGSIIGGAPTYAGASMLGIDPRITFGLIGGGQEALRQKEREANRSLILDKKLTPIQSAGRIATATALNAATGAIFHEADLAKNIVSGMAKAGFGAGANVLTEEIVKRMISGEPQNVPEDLKNAGVQVLVMAAGQGVTRIPALRSEVWKAAEKVAQTKIVGKPKIKSYDEALSILNKEGINPEELSPAWKEAKGIQSEIDRVRLAEKHISEIAKYNGWDKNIVRQVLAENSKKQLLNGYHEWLYYKGKAAGIYEQAKVSYGEQLAKEAISKTKPAEISPEAIKPGQVKAPIAAEQAIPAKTTIPTPPKVVAPPVGPILGQIPVFKNTNEALAFGQANKDKPDILDALKQARDKTLSEIAVIKQNPNPTDAEMQLGLNKAVEAQFYREALEGAKVGTIASQTDIGNKKIDYGMQHRPTEGPPSYDLLAKVDGGDFSPKDIYEHPEWYANGDDSLADRQSIAAIKRLRGNPKAMVTIYRASPKKELNTGDWVSLSNDYAKGESLAENVKVHAFRVKAADVKWAGDSLNEFGYFGKPIKQTPEQIIVDLEKESAYIQKNGKIPPNADMIGFKKSGLEGKYGTTARNQASAYYEYIDNKIKQLSTEAEQKLPIEIPKRMVVAGKITTQSGREIIAPPIIRTDTNRKATKDLKILDAWLLRQAREEAIAKNDDYTQTLFKGLKDKSLSPADKDILNEYLFGETDPKFYQQKNVPQVEESKLVQVVKEKGESSSGKGLGSTAEEQPLEESGITEKEEVNKGEFKLYKEVQALVNKYAKLFGERYQGGQRQGVFYPDTKNIFLKSINNLGTASHEVMHYLDDKFGITKSVTVEKGKSIIGRPIYDSSTKRERKLLTEVYLKYYPTARASHKLKRRVEEGIAVLVQRYITNPESVAEEFPELVDMFFKEGGKYYDSTVNEFIAHGKGIIRKYQQLDPLAKVGAVVMSDSRPVVKDSWLNIKEKIIREVFDNIYPLEKLGKESGNKGTLGDPSLWARLYNNSNAIVINNLISDDRGYWTVKDGSPMKLYDFNWKTIVKKLTDMRSFEEFGTWLVARDTKFNYDLLDKLLKEAEQASQFLKDTAEDRAAGKIGGNIRQDVAEAKRKIDEYKELGEALARNKIPRETAQKAYEQHKERFDEVANMFDKLVRADLDILYNTGMITQKNYSEITAREGYATLKRDVYNELLGVPTAEIPVTRMQVGKNKISSMKSRHGSSLTIINPLYSSMLNHAEIMKKALRQVVYNKIYDLSDKFPELFQEIDLVRSMDKNGRFTYPQERDPNIIMAWSQGKRIPLLVSKEVKTALDELLSYQNLHAFEKILIGANKLFTKGTTGLYIPFTISNFIVDQTTAIAQTNEKIKPIFDPLKTLMTALQAKFAGFESADAKYLEEYLVLGGSRQTLVGWQDLSADDMYRLLTLEKHYLNRAIDTINSVEDFIGFLPKWSEILTRASEYIRARKAGKPVIVAMEEAGRVTAPFHHRGRLGGGTAGRTVIQSLPFFNAALQVLAQYGRTLKDPQTRNRALLVVLAITAASIASLAHIINTGSKKQKEAYKSIPANELSGYIYFPAPDGENLIRLRVPDQMNAIATLMNMAIANEWLDSKYEGPEFIDAATAWIPDQLNITDPARMLTSWIPQLAAPFIGVTLNTKFYPQVRPIENMSMQNRPISERYTEYTSGLAKELGKRLNLSPVKIDYLIQGYMGRYTKFVTGQKIPNPFIREMYFTGSRQLQKYYDIQEQNQYDYSALTKRTKEFTDQEKKDIIRDHGKISLIDTLLKQYRDTEKINKEDPRLQDLRDKIIYRIDTL